METVIAHRLTFAEYMDQALYGPEGYYASGQAHSGAQGDYFTAPDVGSAFGELLAEIFFGWQKKLGLSPFHVVEVGAGEGALAQSITRALAEQTAKFRYSVIDRSPYRRKKLAASLETFGDLRDVPPISGCILANELLDAFPVHRIRIQNGRLEEAYVEEGRLAWGTPSTPKLAAYLERIQIALPEGYETEINLAMAEWLAAASQVLHKGLVLLIDYGRPAHAYYAPERSQGTLRSFRAHRVGADFLGAPGLTDLTADVDFTSAALDARSAGLTPLAYMELGSFLIQGVEGLARSDSRLRAPRSGLQYLIHPDGMGSAFQVLILGKDVPELSEKEFPNNRLARLGLS